MELDEEQATKMLLENTETIPVSCDYGYFDVYVFDTSVLIMLYRKLYKVWVNKTGEV